jgi:hypothetical protein
MKPSLEERQAKATEEALQERFGSFLVLSVKVIRPSPEYPYERAVWESEIRVGIDNNDRDINPIVTAWVKSMEAGVEIAKALGEHTQAKEAA